MITVLALAYGSFRFFKESIDSMIATASESVNFIVIDNLSPESDQIAEYAKSLVDKGSIKKFIKLRNNSRIFAFNYLFEKHLPAEDSEEFFIMTELDLIVPEGIDWISESRLMQNGKAIAGFPLSLINYVPPNGGFDGTFPLTGIWLLSLNTKLFTKEYDKRFRRRNRPLSDNAIRGMMYKYGATRSSSELYHLGWDLWKEPGCEDYWQKKLKGISWDKSPKPQVDYIYTGKES